MYSSPIYFLQRITVTMLDITLWMNVAEAVHARINSSLVQCSALEKKTLEQQHSRSDVMKSCENALIFTSFILKSLHVTFINASILRETERCCMSNEYFLFSLSICNVPVVSTHLTFVLFIRALFIKGNCWYYLLQRPFSKKMMWNYILSVKRLALFQLTDILKIWSWIKWSEKPWNCY